MDSINDITLDSRIKSYAIRKKKLFNLLGLILLVLQCYLFEGCSNLSGRYSIEKITFTNEQDGAILAGTFTSPIGVNRFPVAILISGSGQQDRDETAYGHKPFKVLAEFLSSNGIGVLRYDDRGIGGSTGEVWGATLEVQASDAYYGMRYLKSRRDLDIYSLGIIGHSLGAMQGLMLASEYPDIDFLVMLGGIGMPWKENHIRADILLNKLKGEDEGVIEAGAQLLNSVLNEVSKVDFSVDYQILKNALIEIIYSWKKNLSGKTKKKIDVFTEDNPTWVNTFAEEYATPIYISCAKFDPSHYLTNIDCPVLSIIGEKDVQAIPENNEVIRNALLKGGNEHNKIITPSNINHLFQKCETGVISEYEKIDEDFNRDVMAEILYWIKGIP